MLSVHAAWQFYSTVNIEAIPLKSGTKWPLAESWPTKPIADQWRNVPSNANVGIRHRGDMINIECDNRKVATTFDQVMAGLSGLGVTNPPIVQSASRIGRHVYVACDDAPRELAYRNLAHEVGAGELRIGLGAMSVLPHSQVDGVLYELIAGDWQAIPSVQWHDLLWLLPMQRVITQDENLPVPLIYRPMTCGLSDLFERVARAGRGEAIGAYLSRSEAEAAIVSSLILNGWGFDNIRAEFKQRGVGHYHDAKRHADRYLQTTYANALASIMSSDMRQALAVTYTVAESAAWSGRTGNSDRTTYLALLCECYRANMIETTVSVREISEYAALGLGTAHRALYRLIDEGLIERVKPAAEDGRTATVWKLTGNAGSGTRDTELIPVPDPVRKVTSVPLSAFPELAGRDVLGKSAMLVYLYLSEFEAKSIKRLVQTDRSGTLNS